jgi:hypothetical protein
MMVDALEQWLAVATRGLSAESIKKVRAEITEHHRSASEASAIAGAPPSDANQQAIRALGDAESANRQYRRVLLTAREARGLELATARESRLPTSVALFYMGSSVPISPQWIKRIKMAKRLINVLWLMDMLWLLSNGRLIPSKYDALFWTFVPVTLVAFLGTVLPIGTTSRSRIYRLAKWFAWLWGATLAARHGPFISWIPFITLILPAYYDYRRMRIRGKVPVNQWPQHLYR